MENIKIGVFGTFRGLQYIEAINILDGAEVTAICDRDPEKLHDAKAILRKDIKVCETFDELIHSGIDAVILCNFFNEHAPYAIQAMNAGVHCLSETTAAITMKECVELVETVERTGCIYALAENYPYFRANMEMEEVYQAGALGDVIFAEGEYVHPMSRQENEFYNPGPKHWRSLTPCTYYCTHAMAPLMKITNLMPKKVIGKVAAGRQYAEEIGAKAADNYGLLLVEMDNGALFRVGGCGGFGPKGNWYRLGCTHGGIESVRGNMDKVRLVMNPWNLDAATRRTGTECVYTPALKEGGEKAARFEHGGADYWVTKDFIADIREHKEPYMNVYRAAALSALGILGWKSAVDNSRQISVPDFRSRQERDLYRNDEDSPFYMNGKEPSLPNALFILGE